MGRYKKHLVVTPFKGSAGKLIWNKQKKSFEDGLNEYPNPKVVWLVWLWKRGIVEYRNCFGIPVVYEGKVEWIGREEYALPQVEIEYI